MTDAAGLEVTVVGGGLGGLVAARRLALGGASVTLLEAGDRLGGTVTHHVVGGIVLDAGAESFATRAGTVEGLARSLGLGDEVVPPTGGGSWLHRAAGAVPLPATSIVGIPGVPLARDVVRVVGWRTAARAMLDELIPGTVGDAATSLGALVRRRMGAGVLEQLVAPVVMGVHSQHPDVLEVDRVAPGLRAAMRREGSLAKGVRDLRDRAPAGAAVLGIRGGVHRLVDELAADLDRFGVRVEIGRRVDRDEPLPGEVVWAANDTPVATRVWLVTLVVEQPALDANPRGSGLLVVPGTPGVGAKALTHGTAKWGWLRERAGAGRHVIRLSYDHEPTLAEAQTDAAVLLGTPLGAVVGTDVVAWTRASPRTLTDDERWYVGESVAGTGIANVVAHAERVAGELLAG
ncbi:FAD-dependent oxidoreductase [Galbitalea sp. SE-J8]|uniref:protoporphyrinogen/coproporphyrinogen oxidase n=1 Tax=Galbitalea sp. SE-J8 TaxID=3054952 RepID=UPI00259CA2B6|nr:FAD-dependent oxidoreductase [Galbitalea sp. SE-J8]MDM4763315.1 FAD-dependent oxidoreductase [Galbitalea sp. SE-J8]